MEINFTTWPSHNHTVDSFLSQLHGTFEQEINFRITVSVINVILSFAAVFGNSATLITIWKTSSLHSVSNILLASLAVSDLTVGLVLQPLSIANLVRGENTLFLPIEILGPILVIASLFTITAIAVDRLLALQLHLRYHALVTRFRVTSVVILMWVSAGFFASTKHWISDVSDVALSSMVIVILVGNFFVYLKIYLIVRRHQRQIQHLHRYQQQQANMENILNVTTFKKSALNTFLVYILLVCCYMPYSLSVQLKFAGVLISSTVFTIAFTLIYLNSSLNPLLYCWRDREIRTAMKQLFCRWITVWQRKLWKSFVCKSKERHFVLCSPDLCSCIKHTWFRRSGSWQT